MSRRRLTVYLHIGPPKTGTTYLQDVVWGNRDTLRQRGLDFPGSRLSEHFHAALDLRGIAFGGYDNPDVAGAWPRLAEKALASAGAKVLISHEMFAGATAAQIDRAVASLGPATAHVIYGARDLARQLPAVWQESLKNRRSRSYDAFLSAALKPRAADTEAVGFWKAQDPVATLRKWAAAVPPEQIHVLTLPQAGAPPTTLWERFCAALHVDAAGLDLSVARVNGSLSGEDIEVLRRLNQVLPDDLGWPEYERQVKRRFNARANTASAGSRLTVPEPYREAVVARAAEQRRGLVAAGYDVVGDLQDLLPAPSSFGTPLTPAPDKVTEAAVDILASVLTEQERRGGRRGPAGARTLLGRLRRG